MGHLVRCRALAEGLRSLGKESVLVGPSADFNTGGANEVFADWIPMPFGRSASDDARNFVELMSKHSTKAAVLDDYRVDETYQIELRNAGINWLQFNGKPHQPLWANIILNPSPEANAEDYERSLKIADSRLLLGPSFAVLRSEFNPDGEPRHKDQTLRVLLTFGGGDDRGSVLSVLETLVPALPQHVEFVVVSGSQNPRNADIEKWIADRGAGRVQLEINPPSIAPLISSCDLAIMAGGGSVYEVNCLGLPMLLIAIAENQINHSRAWAQTGAAKYLGELDGMDTDVLLRETRDTIEKIRASDDGCHTHRLVDGMGRIRVAETIVGEFQL